MVVDGDDKTSAALANDRGITWTPPSDLSEGPHPVRVEVSDRVGNPAVKDWVVSIGFEDPASNTGTTTASADGSTTLTGPPNAVDPASGTIQIYVIPLPTSIFDESNLPEKKELQAAVLPGPDGVQFDQPVQLTLQLDDYQVPGTRLPARILR